MIYCTYKAQLMRTLNATMKCTAKEKVIFLKK